ncbi:MAG TPA: AAA family ATPase [Streptosporangiaceae bacterium]
MRLVEREDELMTLRRLLAASRSGRGNVVLISGPVASGKTALLQVFAEEASLAGVVCLHASASTSEQALSLEIMGQLIASATLSPEIAKRTKRLLNAGALVGHLNDPRSSMARQVPHLLRELSKILLGIANHSTVLISVDDAHNADVASLECLLYLTRRLRSARILVVLTERASEWLYWPHLRAEFLQTSRSHYIPLNLLSPSGVTKMLASNGNHDASQASILGLAWHEMSGGNPLLVQALLADNETSRPVNAAESAPAAAFGQAVMTSIHRCGPAATDVATAVAILGEHASPPMVGELLESSPASVVQAMGVLNAGGLLDSGRFRHEAARAAVIQSLEARQRATLNRRAARILHDRGMVSSAVAEHLVTAGGSDSEWALPVLCEAADQALLDGDVTGGVRYLRTAYEACSDERRRIQIKARIAQAEWRIDPSAAARCLSDLVTDALADRLEWRDAIRLIACLLWDGRLAQAVEVLKAIERRIDSKAEPDINVTCGAELLREWITCLCPGLAHRVAPEQPDATVRPLPSGQPTSLQAVRLLRAVLANGAADDAIAQAETVLRCSLSDSTLVPISSALTALTYIKPDRAAIWCESLLKEADRLQAPMWQALLTAMRANIEMRRGHLLAAEASARAALTLVSPKSWGLCLGVPVASVLLASTALGKYEEAAAYVLMPVPDAMFQTLGALYYLQARGRFYLATDNPQMALHDFQACGNLMIRWEVDCPTAVPWRTDAAGAWLRLGDQDKARDLAEEQLSMLGSHESWARGISLRMLAIASEHCYRPTLLTEAADALQKSGDLYELALTLAELGRACYALGDAGRARIVMRRANRLAQACGIGPVNGTLSADITDTLSADRIGEVGPAAADNDPAAQLSEAERRVAVLAAQGYTNRQIADELFITISTVEQHLTHVYRKLRLSRRVDLPRELLRSAAN